MDANRPWGCNGPEPTRHDWRDAVIDRLQRRLEATDNPTDREVLQIKIMDLLRRQSR